MERPLSTTCPFCGSTDVERVSAWGGQIITCQMRCGGCQSYFEALRADFEAPAAPGGGRTEAS